jgi:capsular exopolysaccharide synthesis family protein
MSKFFDETQKARQWVVKGVEPVQLDVVSVIDAIKQNELEDIGPATPALPSIRQVQVDKVINNPITVSKIDSLSAVSEAYGTLRTRVMRLQASKGIRSIMLTSAVPGEGKTVTALNLALSCAKLHEQRILLVDGDLRSRGLTRLIAMPEGVGLSDVLSEKSSIDEAVLATEHENLFVVGSGSPCSQPAELFASTRWSEFIAWSNQSFDVIIVDAPPVHSLTDAELISAGCDGVLLVVRALSTPREMARKSAGRLDKKKLIGIVFNGLPNSRENRYSYYGVSS